MKEITSPQNDHIKDLMSLHQKKNRDAKGLFLVEGEHLIEEALKTDCVEEILSDEESRFAFENSIRVTPNIMKKLSTNVSDVHYIAVCKKLDNHFEAKRRVVLLDGIQDPGNVGTIIRSAHSFGFDGIICSKDCCDLYNDKTIRSTQGAFFHIPVIRNDLKESIDELKGEGFEVIGTALAKSIPLDDLKEKEKMAFVFGSEGSGISKDIFDCCDTIVKIDMENFDSLNVAVATGIILHKYK